MTELGFRQEGGDDPALQVAPEDGGGLQVRLSPRHPDRRLLRPLRRMPAQQETDPLPLHPVGGLRQGLHLDERCPDALQLPQKRQCYSTRRISQVRKP
jgi:hypothetical protein